MSGRMSNRDRIAHAALEAEEARKQKAKAAESKSPPSRGRTPAAAKPEGRTRIVWSVCDQRGDSVATFPFPKEDEARAEAERLTEASGRTHFVKRDEEAFE